jgi:hypothetical protein
LCYVYNYQKLPKVNNRPIGRRKTAQSDHPDSIGSAGGMFYVLKTVATMLNQMTKTAKFQSFLKQEKNVVSAETSRRATF